MLHLDVSSDQVSVRRCPETTQLALGRLNAPPPVSTQVTPWCDGSHTIYQEPLLLTRARVVILVLPPIRVKSACTGGRTVSQSRSFDMDTEAELAKLITLGNNM